VTDGRAREWVPRHGPREQVPRHGTEGTGDLLALMGEGFVFTASCGPLRTADGEGLRRRLDALREGFRFVKFGDNPRARPSVAPWAAAVVALERGLEPVVHLACRDRNRLALQSELMGCRVLGIRHVLCLRGDEPDGTRGVRAVHDTDVTELLALARQVDERFVLLAAADPDVDPEPALRSRLRDKVRAGARVLETQPVFDPERLARWVAAVGEDVRVPFLVDVMVVADAEQLATLRRILPVRVPEGLKRSLRGPGDGVRLAADIVHAVREVPGVRGCHLSTLTGDVRLPLAVLERVGT
jgi:5,10-methylenetetrahydrofolate reductase